MNSLSMMSVRLLTIGSAMKSRFLIVAACVFVLVKAVNKIKRVEPPAPPAPPKSEVLLEEIRDLLKK